jgi:hypothetical protein
LTIDNNEKSASSDSVRVQTLESRPSAPVNLRTLAATTTQLKLGWDAPEKTNGNLKGYFIYKDEDPLDFTNIESFILTGLQPSSTYEISVCASNSEGKGEKATIRCSTCSLGDVTPDRPNFGLIGTREVLVRWQPPEVVTGKLTRYELSMNGKCIYSGVALEHQVTMLKPDTEYRFEVRCLRGFI